MSPANAAKMMKISTAARAAGVTRQQIEYYVMLGLIDPITPPGTRRRFFDDALVRRIRLIRELNDTGYTLREIRTTWLRNR